MDETSAATWDVLTACCLPKSSAGFSARVRECTARVRDWKVVLAVAENHGLVPLLCCRVLQGAPDLVDEAGRARLGTAARTAAARALDAERQLLAVVDALAGAGIPTLPYKGPALALAAYGDAALRSCEDLDVVVAPSDLSAANEALSAAGYAPDDGRAWRASLAANGWQGHVAFANAGAPLPVELHWRFCDRKLPWNPSVRSVLARSTRWPFASSHVAIPEVHDQLVLVLLHAARHGWDRLEHMACIAALISDPARPVDPQLLIARARAVRGRRAVLVGLEVARRVLGIPLPAAIRDAIGQDQDLPTLASDGVARVTAGDAGTARDARLHLASLDGSMDRARYVALAALLPTDQDYNAVAVPRGLGALYVPLRLSRLLWRSVTR